MKGYVDEIICKCKKVKRSDIERALYDLKTMEDVEAQFKHVQEITHCSTGCGGCHNKILDIISEYISG